MSSRQQTGHLIEALDAQNLEREKLFQLIAALANCLDKGMVVEIMQRVLGIDPMEIEDSVHFDDVAVAFDEGGRVKSLYRVIDGNANRAGAEHRGNAEF